MKKINLRELYPDVYTTDFLVDVTEEVMEAILYAVDKQPVRENMTFPMACPIAGQVMVTVLIRQRFAHRQQRYDLLQQLDLQATLDGSFVVFFETGRVLDGIFGFFHLFRSANNSSRSL